MAKRFTDNEKWKDTWFIDLPTKYKLFWIYILDECNHAGIWKVNFKVASFFIGEHLEDSEVKRILKDRIIVLNDNYWYVKKFIKYQYKLEIQELNPKNKLHLSVLKLLNEYKEFKPLASPLLGVKDKEKDIDKDINSYNEINNLYEKFVEEVKKGGFATRIESLYMRLRLEKGSLTFLLKDFKNHIIEENRLHKNTNDFFINFKNWLNTQDRIKNLEKYKR